MFITPTVIIIAAACPQTVQLKYFKQQSGFIDEIQPMFIRSNTDMTTCAVERDTVNGHGHLLINAAHQCIRRHHSCSAARLHTPATDACRSACE